MASTLPHIEETDSLANLEQRIERAVQLLSQLRQERDAAVERAHALAGSRKELDEVTAERDELAAAKRELEEQNSRLIEEIQALKGERKQVRARIEKLLGQMDVLGSAV